MRDFLHGWRRKVGLAFLGVALLLTVRWFRSMVIQDEYWTMIGGNFVGTNSASGGLEIWRTAASDYDMRGDWYVHVGYLHAGRPNLNFSASLYREQWHRLVVGFSVGCFIELGVSFQTGQPKTWYVIRGPYWELVLISTFIAAALILPRPRRITRRPNDATSSVTSTALSADAVPAAPRGASGC